MPMTRRYTVAPRRCRPLPTRKTRPAPPACHHRVARLHQCSPRALAAAGRSWTAPSREACAVPSCAPNPSTTRPKRTTPRAPPRANAVSTADAAWTVVALGQQKKRVPQKHAFRSRISRLRSALTSFFVPFVFNFSAAGRSTARVASGRTRGARAQGRHGRRRERSGLRARDMGLRHVAHAAAAQLTRSPRGDHARRRPDVRSSKVEARAAQPARRHAAREVAAREVAAYEVAATVAAVCRALCRAATHQAAAEPLLAKPGPAAASSLPHVSAGGAAAARWRVASRAVRQRDGPEPAAPVAAKLAGRVAVARSKGQHKHHRAAAFAHPPERHGAADEGARACVRVLRTYFVCPSAKGALQAGWLHCRLRPTSATQPHAHAPQPMQRIYMHIAATWLCHA